MQPTPWNTRLDEATTDSAVISVCDGFVTSCTFEELGQIPAACQPHHVVAAADVGPYAEKLVARLGEGDSAPPLQRMSAFFSQAALRLAQIADARSSVELVHEPRPVEFPYR